MRIRSREDVIGYVAANCGNRSIQRALEEGCVEYLGGFEPRGGDPCWMLCSTTPNGKKFNVALVANRDGTHSIRTVDQIPWECWLGSTTAGKLSDLIHGDRPERYAHLKSAMWRLNNVKEV